MSTEKEHITLRVPNDTYKEFVSYKEAREVSKSDAGRRLLERGLSEIKEESTDDGASSASFLYGYLTVSSAVLTAFTVGVFLYWFFAMRADLTEFVAAMAIVTVVANGFAFGARGRGWI